MRSAWCQARVLAASAAGGGGLPERRRGRGHCHFHRHVPGSQIRWFAGWCPALITRIAGAFIGGSGIVPAATSVPAGHRLRRAGRLVLACAARDASGGARCAHRGVVLLGASWSSRPRRSRRARPRGPGRSTAESYFRLGHVPRDLQKDISAGQPHTALASRRKHATDLISALWLMEPYGGMGSVPPPTSTPIWSRVAMSARSGRALQLAGRHPRAGWCSFRSW
jgi:hypothetical protein